MTAMNPALTLRLNDIKLPLAHSAAELTAAVLAALSMTPDELQDVAVYKRSYDARKKSDIQLIYSLDVRLSDAARRTCAGRERRQQQDHAQSGHHL